MNATQSTNSKRKFILPVLLTVAGCAVFLFAAWMAVKSPALASVFNAEGETHQAARPKPFGQFSLAKPQNAPPLANTALQPAEQNPLPTPTPQQAAQAAPTATFIPPTAALLPPTDEVIPTVEAVEVIVETPTPQPEENSGTLIAEIVPDTPTPEYVAPTAAPYVPVAGSGERWIDVDLTQQRLYAYEGDTLVNSFVVSTGTWQTPTVTGKYKVWVKLRSAAMSGPGYYLPNVPYIMYFYGSYGIHGTYWHNNFGTPMSHGCVNMTIADAEWLYNFASVGTVVNVHY